MISSAPFTRFLAEKEIDLEQFSQITGIPYPRLATFRYGILMNQEELDVMCKVLKCQPCNLIEYKKENVGWHWEWVCD